MSEALPPMFDLPDGCLFCAENGDMAILTRDSALIPFFIINRGGIEHATRLTEYQYTKLTEAKNKTTLEIERKFLLEHLPDDLHQYSQTHIEQPYLIIADKNEVRIRKKTKKGVESFTLTIKSGNGVIRGEFETDITRGQYERLRTLHVGNIIDKIRFDNSIKTSSDKEHTIELDVYFGTLAGNTTAEVEFETESEAESFQKPNWFGPDKSDDKRLKNKNLALHGFPNNTYSQEFAKKMSDQVESILEK